MPLIIEDDMIGNIIVAVATIGASVVASIVWVGTLGHRLGRLEEKMKEFEGNYVEQNKALVASMEKIRDDIHAGAISFANAREEALRQFADNDDLHRLEEKVDTLLERPSVRRTVTKHPRSHG